MASINKFEQLLEYVVNGEQAKAEELFHALVVAKSREIYENLINEEMEDDDDVEESRDDDEDDEDSDDVDESWNMEASDDDDSDSDFGGDASDDALDDMGSDDEEDDMGGDHDGSEDEHMGHDEGSEENRLSDLEDALADLKAEFEMLVKGEEAEEHNNPGIHDMGGDDMGGDMGGDMGMDQPEDEGYGMFEEEIEEIAMSPAEMMREYVDKIGEPYKSGGSVSNTKEGGHVGAQAGSVTGSTYTKSPVAKKNDMGGTTANIARGGEAGKGGTQGGLANPTTKEENFGNINVPGGKAGKTGFTHKVSDGHGTEKKGKGEAGGTNTKSLFR
jgi:hypothetical protein